MRSLSAHAYDSKISCTPFSASNTLLNLNPKTLARMVQKNQDKLASCLKRKRFPGFLQTTGISETGEFSERNVKFADILGKELVSVKTITPNSSLDDLEKAVISRGGSQYNRTSITDRNNNIAGNCTDLLNTNGIAVTKTPPSLAKQRPTNYLKCCFSQPSTRDDFVKHAVERRVCLENAFVGGYTRMVLLGLIRVLNTAYTKYVFIRFTFDCWSSYVDLPADYMTQSGCGLIDKFVFKLVAPQYFEAGDTIEFAVCYRVNGQEYWDNNECSNYVVKCCE